MEFIPFYAKFPKIATHEGCVFKVNNSPEGLSDGEYIAVEMYCSDDTCDCRKVMLNMISVSQQKLFAIIGYGWESLAYYREWMHGDRKMSRMMKGIYIEPCGMQLEYNFFFLKKIKELIANNSEVTTMIKRHYALFKGKLPK